jgi:protein-disulfide isomerase
MKKHKVNLWVISTIALAIILVISLIQGWHIRLTLFAGQKETSKAETIQLPSDYYTSTPGVDLSSLTQDQKTLALKIMNEESCPCGCEMSIAECRNNDPQCTISVGLGKRVVNLAGQDKDEDAIKFVLKTETQETRPTQIPTQQRVEVSVDDDPFKGEENAPVTIIEFSDYQCPFCKKVEPTINQIIETYGDKIRFVYRDFPLGFHKYAQKAAEAAECADEQGKFWEYHDKLFENQQAINIENMKQWAKDLNLDSSKFDECLDSGKYASEVQKDFEDGQAIGVSGTPTFFINGQRLVGAQPFSAFKAVIDDELGK